MIAGSLARRYAKALVEVVAAQPGDAAAQLATVGRELREFAAVLRMSKDLSRFFGNPGVLIQDKQRVLQRLVERAGVGATAATFLRLVLDKGRLPGLETISLAYDELMDEHLGRVKAVVTAAVPMDGGIADALRLRLERATGKGVYLEVRQDPSILGGLVTQIGSTVYDGSLRALLRQVRGQMLRG